MSGYKYDIEELEQQAAAQDVRKYDLPAASSSLRRAAALMRAADAAAAPSVKIDQRPSRIVDEADYQELLRFRERVPAIKALLFEVGVWVEGAYDEPVDTDAVRKLHRLWLEAARTNTADPDIAELIQRAATKAAEYE